MKLLLRASDPDGQPLVLLRQSAEPQSAEPQSTGRGTSGTLTGPWRWELPEAAPGALSTPSGLLGRITEQAAGDPAQPRQAQPRHGQPRIRGVWTAGAGVRTPRIRGGSAALEPEESPLPASSGSGAPPPVVIADVPTPFATAGPGTASFAWVPESDIGTLALDPVCAAVWPALRAPRTGLLVDAANVIGSRPDGWWRDRAGAATRLLNRLAEATPGVLIGPHGEQWWIVRPVVVLEGVARRAPDVGGLEVVRAPGAGDDTIVDVARGGGSWVVVTADRGLRARLPAAAQRIGPATLLSWLSPPVQ